MLINRLPPEIRNECRGDRKISKNVLIAKHDKADKTAKIISGLIKYLRTKSTRQTR